MNKGMDLIHKTINIETRTLLNAKLLEQGCQFKRNIPAIAVLEKCEFIVIHVLIIYIVMCSMWTSLKTVQKCHNSTLITVGDWCWYHITHVFKDLHWILTCQ